MKCYVHTLTDRIKANDKIKANNKVRQTIARDFPLRPIVLASFLIINIFLSCAWTEESPVNPPSLHDQDLLDGTQNHQELIERVISTNDWRLLRLLMGRAGISSASNSERVQALATVMQQHDRAVLDASLRRAGITWDTQTAMSQRWARWQQIEGLDEPYQRSIGTVQLLGCASDLPLLHQLEIAIPLVQHLHQSTFPFPQADERPLHIHIYPHRELYDSQDYRAGSYATYRPSQGKIALWIDHKRLQKNRRHEIVRLIQALAHEMWHSYIQYHAPGMPIWMEEGIAEVFESALVRGNQDLHIGPDIINATNLQAVRQHMKQDNLIPTDDLMSLTNRSFTEQAQVAYPQSWSLMHSIMFSEDDHIAQIPHRVIAHLRRGLFAEEATTAALNGIDSEDIDAHWRTFLRRQQSKHDRPQEYPPEATEVP